MRDVFTSISCSILTQRFVLRRTTIPAAPEHREAIRLVIGYFLGCADRLTRVLGHDLDTSVVYAALAWENVRDFTLPVRGETAEQAEARLHGRTPISVYRLSQMIGMPYETTRRHVGRLSASGLCHRRGPGMIAPSLAQPQATRIAQDTWDATLALLHDLGDLGFTSPPPRVLSPFQTERRVARLSIRYFLSGLTAMTTALELDMLTALMFLAINRHNFQAELKGRELVDILPDDWRRPISTYLLAKQLGLSYETARRHMLKLLKAGLCVRVAEGLIIPGEVFTRPALVAASGQAWGVTVDFLENLADVGVTIVPPASGLVAAS